MLEARIRKHREQIAEIAAELFRDEQALQALTSSYQVDVDSVIEDYRRRGTRVPPPAPPPAKRGAPKKGARRPR